MYERFTDRARKIMQLANQECQRFNHEFLDTEHILLGLVKEGTGVAANVLKNLEMDIGRIRRETENLSPAGPAVVSMGKMPLSPRAKKVVEYSIEEARNLNHNYVGTEHLLLGLLREQEGVAAKVLTNCGLKAEDVREEVMLLLGHKKDDPKSELPQKVEGVEFGRGLVVTLTNVRYEALTNCHAAFKARINGHLDKLLASFTDASKTGPLSEQAARKFLQDAFELGFAAFADAVLEIP